MLLGQRRFRNGALYLSISVRKGLVDAIDCRYFVERNNTLAPTKSGFRVHRGGFGAFGELVHLPPEKVTVRILGCSSTRELIARRCDDVYGKGIDFRYYRSSDSYKGWEKRGIRLGDEDFVCLAEILRDFGVLSGAVPTDSNLFSGKVVASSEKRGSARSTAGRDRSSKASLPDTWTPVGLALNKFLSED